MSTKSFATKQGILKTRSNHSSVAANITSVTGSGRQLPAVPNPITVIPASETQSQSHIRSLSGFCQVCRRRIHLTSAGVLYKHGPGRGCAGSGCLPVEGSDSVYVHLQTVETTADHTGSHSSQQTCDITPDAIVQRIVNN